MARAKSQGRKPLDDVELIERLRSILINAAEGQRSIGDDRQYPELRKEFARRQITEPSLIATHPTVDSFMAAMRSTKDRNERVARILEDFKPVFQSFGLEYENGPGIDASKWTGQADRVARLKVVRELLPVARTTIEAMIETLSQPGPNHGPLLDEREEAIGHLRELHGKLGELLTAIDGGRFDDDLGQGLAAEAVRLAKNIRDNVREEPLPCAVAGLLLTIFTAAHMPVAGAFLSDAAYRFSTKRKVERH
jgi:hypothetical protein